jgi:hypothetical protein
MTDPTREGGAAWEDWCRRNRGLDRRLRLKHMLSRSWAFAFQGLCMSTPTGAILWPGLTHAGLSVNEE